MVKVPIAETQEHLQPTPINPEMADALGEAYVDVGKGLAGLGDSIQKLQNRTQTLKAETYMAKVRDANYKIAANDPDIFNLEKKIADNTQTNLDEAARIIQDPVARNEFIAKSGLDMERRNIPIYSMIVKRQSQDFKASLLQANDEDIKEYQALADPAERELIRDRIKARTEEAASYGYVNKDWANHYLTTHLKEADMAQVRNDMSIDAEATYRELQKGAEGLYPELSPSQRKQFADKAQKQIAKQGAENNMIFSIAQNHSENVLIDKMSMNALTQEDINNAQIMGINGIKIRPEFAKAATEALQDPFPGQTNAEVYTQLFEQVTDPEKDAFEVKLNIMRSRGLTPAQKAHLINGAFRKEDGEGSKQSIGELIRTGLQRNKQDILEINHQIEKSVESKRTVLGKIGQIFSNHAKDDAHLADLQQQLMQKSQQLKNNQDLIDLSKNIIKQDVLNDNPKFSSFPKEGKIMIDSQGNKARVYPDGSVEEL